MVVGSSSYLCFVACASGKSSLRTDVTTGLRFLLLRFFFPSSSCYSLSVSSFSLLPFLIFSFFFFLFLLLIPFSFVLFFFGFFFFPYSFSFLPILLLFRFLLIIIPFSLFHFFSFPLFVHIIGKKKSYGRFLRYKLWLCQCRDTAITGLCLSM